MLPVSISHSGMASVLIQGQGWLCTTAWQTGVSSSAFLAGTTIQGLFVLNIKDYTFHSWHGTLLVIAIATVAICFNTLLARQLPLLEGFLVILHLLGIVVVIPLWALSPLRSGGAVLTEYYNGGGWSSKGLSTMVGKLFWTYRSTWAREYI